MAFGWIRTLGGFFILAIAFFCVLGPIQSNISPDDLKKLQKKANYLTDNKNKENNTQIVIGGCVYNIASSFSVANRTKDVTKEKFSKYQQEEKGKFDFCSRKWKWWYGVLIVILLFVGGEFLLKKFSGHGGFSLIEILISVSIFWVLLAVIMHLFLEINPFFKSMNARLSRTVKASNFGAFLLKQLSSVCEDTNHPVAILDLGQRLDFYTCNVLSDGSCAFENMRSIFYQNGEIKLAVDGSEFVAAQNISFLQFSLDGDKIQVQYKIDDVLYGFCVRLRRA